MQCDPALYDTGYYVQINPATGVLTCGGNPVAAFNMCHREQTPDTCNPATGYFRDCSNNHGVAALCVKRF